jgi:predicted CXXCH cytochrome family protein
MSPERGATKRSKGKPGKAVGRKISSPEQHRKSSTRSTSKFPWPVVGIAAAIVLLLAGSGLGFAASQEENDSFCASCHTQPESTYYERSLAATPVDMASSHHTTNDQNSKCIDCHSGSGITGRLAAMLLGARNAFMLFTHTATQPAPLTVPIQDENCIKCHDNISRQTDLSNHFHAFLARWQAADPKAASCVDCHSAHTTGGDAAQGYLLADRVNPICDRCHQALVLN